MMTGRRANGWSTIAQADAGVKTCIGESMKKAIRQPNARTSVVARIRVTQG